MSEFSFKDTGSDSVEASPAASSEPADGMLTMSKAASRSDEPTVEIALRWSRMYERDHEFQDFWRWVSERSNPERTDQHEILESIPAHFGPDQLPMPLRKFFLRKFGDEKAR